MVSGDAWAREVMAAERGDIGGDEAISWLQSRFPGRHAAVAGAVGDLVGEIVELADVLVERVGEIGSNQAGTSGP